MRKLYRTALQRRRPFCSQEQITVTSVFLIGLGCFLVLFITATFQNDAWSNTDLYTFSLWGIVGGGALQLLGSFYPIPRIARVVVMRAQKGGTRES